MNKQLLFNSIALLLFSCNAWDGPYQDRNGSGTVITVKSIAPFGNHGGPESGRPKKENPATLPIEEEEEDEESSQEASQKEAPHYPALRRENAVNQGHPPAQSDSGYGTAASLETDPGTTPDAADAS